MFKGRTILLALLLTSSLIVIIPGGASALQEGDYMYEVGGIPAVATITEYTGNGGAIMIPSSLGGFPTAIIQHEAFNNADGYKVTSVLIPNTVHTIQNYAFSNSEILTAAYIGSGVTSFGEEVFYNCRGLTEIVVHSDNPSYTSIDGVLYDEAMTNLIKCPSGKAGSVTIPDTVTLLSWHAFDACRNLEQLTIGRGITAIGPYTFQDSTSLVTLNFASGSALVSIGDWAFASCQSLVAIDLPSNLEVIEDSAFQNCEALVSVVLPSGLTTIGNSAFGSCTSLIDITIPAALTDIGRYAFAGCSGMTAFEVDQSNSAFCSIDGVLYNKTATRLIQCPGAKTGSLVVPDSVITIDEGSVAVCQISSVIIGDQVETIGMMAFFKCMELTSVEMGDRVRVIEGAAFASCKLLRTMVIPASITDIGGQAFADCASLTNITFLGTTTQFNVGTGWTQNTPAEIRGHAYEGSSFPVPGATFYGLTMGPTMVAPEETGDMTGLILLLVIVGLAGTIAISMVIKYRRKGSQ